MSAYEMTGRLDMCERINNSFSGNPRFCLTLVTSGSGDYSPHTGDDCHGDHMYRTFSTASDASFNYEVGNKGLRVGDLVVVTINGRGTVSDMRAKV